MILLVLQFGDLRLGESPCVYHPRNTSSLVYVFPYLEPEGPPKFVETAKRIKSIAWHKILLESGKSCMGATDAECVSGDGRGNRDEDDRENHALPVSF